MNSPKRVLHIARALNRGGVETWLMHVLRRIDPRRIQMDFLVHVTGACAYDAEILDRGSRLLRCEEPLWSPAYTFRVSKLLRQSGSYDAVHSHVHHFSGYLLQIASRHAVPIRIAHSHSDTSRYDAAAGRLRRWYLQISKKLISANATRLVGASRPAARSLFGARWEFDARSLLLHCGIDLSAFTADRNRQAVRSRLGIGEGEIVVGHVGSFTRPKNHGFMIDVAAEAIRLRPEIRVLFVGDGELRRAIEDRTRTCGLSKNIIFTGVRNDVPDLLGAMDVFMFPSRWEGLPLALLEAQASGLPCVVSEAISTESDVVPQLVDRVSLRHDPAYWAARLLTRATCPRPERRHVLNYFQKSDFDIANSLEKIYALYGA